MTYEIRKAQLRDVDWIVKDAGYKMVYEELKKPDLYDVHTIQALTIKCIQDGTVLLVSKGSSPVGVLGAVAVPHYLNRNQVTLAEIMWYVDKENRNGRAGLLLLKAFADMAKQKGCKATLSLLASSNISDNTLERFGFKLTERNYLMEN